MDYIYNVNNINNIYCVIQEKDSVIERQQKEIEELRKVNQSMMKENEKLRNDLDLVKKLNDALEKFKFSLERNIQVLKEFDKSRWSISDAENEVKIWEHEYLMVRKTLDRKEKEELAAATVAAAVTGIIVPNQNVPPKTTSRRNPPKPKIAEDGTALKRYVCDYPNCTYRSNWAHDLKGHKRKHTGEKPYTCGWLNCNKSFRDLRDLKRHQRAHTGDKRYSCDWPGCDYRSTDVANLAKHKRTHTGEKPYKCDWAGCEARFADGSHLRRHQKKHENQLAKIEKNKTSSPTGKKRRNQNKNSTSTTKTRQQPSRKAKSAGTPAIPLEVILSVAEGAAFSSESDKKETENTDSFTTENVQSEKNPEKANDRREDISLEATNHSDSKNLQTVQINSTTQSDNSIITPITEGRNEFQIRHSDDTASMQSAAIGLVVIGNISSTDIENLSNNARVVSLPQLNNNEGGSINNQNVITSIHALHNAEICNMQNVDTETIEPIEIDTTQAEVSVNIHSDLYNKIFRQL